MTRFYRNNDLYSHRFFSVTAFFPKISFIVLVFSLLFSSCEEDPTTIGKNILPGSDFVEISSIDTISTVAYTMYDDSTRSNNPPTSYLGEIWDPYFGTTSASFVTQLRLKERWDSESFAGDSLIADSVKLILKFETVSGAVGGNHYINLYEIGNFLYDTTYYTTTSARHSGMALENIPLPALKADTVNQIEVDIPVEFSKRIFQDTTMLFHSNNVSDFRSYFNGLHVTLTSDADPVLASLILQNNNDGFLILDRYYKNFFVLYYHDKDNKPRAFYLMLDAVNRNISYNKIDHNFLTAENPIEHINDFYSDTLSYLQNLNGVYTRIVVPGLSEMKTNPEYANIAVNKARLTVPYYTDGTRFTNKTVPRQVYVRYRTVSGIKPLVQDYIIDQQSFFDGLVDTTKQVFNFNLATYLQAFIEDKTGDILPELEIFQSSSNSNMIFRVNDNPKPVGFEVTYTKF